MACCQMFGNMQKWQKQIEGLLNNGGEERPYKVDVAPKMVNWHNSRLSALGGTWRRRAAGARVPSRKQKTPSIVDFTPPEANRLCRYFYFTSQPLHLSIIV